MNNYNKKSDGAQIQLLHIMKTDEPKLHFLIKKIWFFYSTKHIKTHDQETELLDKLNLEKPGKLFDILIADLRPSSPFKPDHKTPLFNRLTEHQLPMISISSENEYSCDDHNPNWLHITLPIHQINKYAPEIKNSLANFWFSLPRK